MTHLVSWTTQSRGASNLPELLVGLMRVVTRHLSQSWQDLWYMTCHSLTQLITVVIKLITAYHIYHSRDKTYHSLSQCITVMIRFITAYHNWSQSLLDVSQLVTTYHSHDNRWQDNPIWFVPRLWCNHKIIPGSINAIHTPVSRTHLWICCCQSKN